MFCGSGGLENTFAKAAGAEPSGQMRDGKSGRRSVREANFAVKMRKIVELGKSARICGAKRVSKSKWLKTVYVRTTVGS